MMPMHWPLPSAPAGKSYSLASAGGVNDWAETARTPSTGSWRWKCGSAAGRSSRPNTPSTTPARSPGTLIVPVRPR